MTHSLNSISFIHLYICGESIIAQDPVIIKRTSQTNKTRDLVRAVATKVVNREPNVQQMDKDAANAKE